MGSSTQWALRPAGAGTRTPCSAEWRGRMVTVCREGGSLPETPPWPWRQLPEPEMPSRTARGEVHPGTFRPDGTELRHTRRRACPLASQWRPTLVGLPERYEWLPFICPQRGRGPSGEGLPSRRSALWHHSACRSTPSDAGPRPDRCATGAFEQGK
jgi:hypothetical protein